MHEEFSCTSTHPTSISLKATKWNRIWQVARRTAFVVQCHHHSLATGHPHIHTGKHAQRKTAAEAAALPPLPTPPPASPPPTPPPPEAAHLRHVHVINEHNKSLSRRWTVRVLCPLLNVCLQVSLNIHRRCTWWKVDIQKKLNTMKAIRPINRGRGQNSTCKESGPRILELSWLRPRKLKAKNVLLQSRSSDYCGPVSKQNSILKSWGKVKKCTPPNEM